MRPARVRHSRSSRSGSGDKARRSRRFPPRGSARSPGACGRVLPPRPADLLLRLASGERDVCPGPRRQGRRGGRGRCARAVRPYRRPRRRLGSLDKEAPTPRTFVLFVFGAAKGGSCEHGRDPAAHPSQCFTRVGACQIAANRSKRQRVSQLGTPSRYCVQAYTPGTFQSHQARDNRAHRPRHRRPSELLHGRRATAGRVDGGRGVYEGRVLHGQAERATSERVSARKHACRSGSCAPRKDCDRARSVSIGLGLGANPWLVPLRRPS
jgi:hypothetical protein